MEPPVPTNGDGKLYVSFISTGQGDCVMASLPNGKTLMVDCGTSRWDTDYNRGEAPDQPKKEQSLQIRLLRQQVIDTIFEPRFLKDCNRIDALVMTHPDKDHCNELASCLSDKHPAIGAVYYSSGSLDNYVQGSAGWWLTTKANVGARYAVGINQYGRKFNGLTIPNEATPIVKSPSRPINVVAQEMATLGMVRILDGTRAGGKNCEVFLLAGDVTTYDAINDHSTPQNRGSVVTLIVFGTLKILLCGDGTFNTEKFIKDTYGAKIQDLGLVQIPHHGSMTSSSWWGDGDPNVRDINFVGHVRPERAIVSAATDSGGSLKLPRYEVIQRYLDTPKPRLVAATRSIHSWLHTPGTYGMDKRRKRVMLTAPSEDWEMRHLTVDVVSTGTDGTFDYTFTDAEV